MRYPRAFFIFDKQEILPGDDFFQGLTSSNKPTYLQGISRPIRTIEKEIELIKSIDIYFHDFQKISRDILVISHPKIIDFLMAFFADKNLTIYWIDNKSMFENIFIAKDALEELACMDSFLYDASHAYSYAYRGFYHLTKRNPHPYDEVIITIEAMASGELRTVLESELRVVLKKLLSINVISRFDL